MLVLLSIANYEKTTVHQESGREMLTTGNQLRAARSLAGIDQGELAKRAGVNINTISAMEKRGAEILTSGLDTIKSVMSALEAAGIEFLNHGQPGVRLRPKPIAPMDADKWTNDPDEADRRWGIKKSQDS
jgi:transcriptional regulator with XRE-family HTH domain